MSEKPPLMPADSPEDELIPRAASPSGGSGSPRYDVVAMASSSPFPPSAELEQYERISPGSAGMIFDQFRREGDHRRALDVREMRNDHQIALIGVVFAGVFATAALVLGVVLIVRGYSGGYLISLVGVGAIVATFIWGTRRPG